MKKEAEKVSDSDFDARRDTFLKDLQVLFKRHRVGLRPFIGRYGAEIEAIDLKKLDEERAKREAAEAAIKAATEGK